MSDNTSATGGYLVPIESPFLEGNELDDFFINVVQSITRLPVDMVRPRWQHPPPTQPEPEVDWCGVGIVGRTGQDFPAIVHHAEGFDEMQRQGVLELQASFYGPFCDSYAEVLRDGLYVSQNVEYLRKANLGLRDVGDVVVLPELVNEVWIKRADVTIRIARETIRKYPVRNIAKVVFTGESNTGVAISGTIIAP